MSTPTRDNIITQALPITRSQYDGITDPATTDEYRILPASSVPDLPRRHLFTTDGEHRVVTYDHLLTAFSANITKRQPYRLLKRKPALTGATPDPHLFRLAYDHHRNPFMSVDSIMIARMRTPDHYPRPYEVWANTLDLLAHLQKGPISS